MLKTMDRCSSFTRCTAPLCPLNEGFEDAVWYPDEPICNSTKFRSAQWLKIQKRIKKLKLGYSTGYFTAGMLSEIQSVRLGIKGIDPDGRIARDNDGQDTLFSEISTSCSLEIKHKGVKGYQDTHLPNQLVLV